MEQADLPSDDYSEILEPPSRPGLIGMLGDYEIEEKVAAGGMGIVFKARDVLLNRTVAIKVLRLSQVGMNDARKRFFREAQAVAGIDHENIVPIYQVNHEAKSPYLVMPFIRGQTLDEVVKARGAPLAAKEVATIARQIASGLAAAHDRGLIHRDIKPANLLLENETNRIWIADFGLARAIWDPALTQSGSLTGTPLFMSPEQASEGIVGARSDLFSLGSVLYYLATARLPFAGARSLSILRKVCEDDPPAVSELNSNIPDWLARLITRLMQKDPADRPQSAEEIIAMLDHPELSETNSARRSATAKKRQTIPVWAAVGVALAGVAAIAIAFHGGGGGFLNNVLDPESPAHRTDGGDASSGVTIVRPNGAREAAATLSSAVNSVGVGDVIELSQASDASFLSATLRLERAVTLRAGKGQSPVIEFANTLFDTAWPLKLEGLVLRCTDPDTPLIRTSGSELSLVNCQIESGTPGAPMNSPQNASQMVNLVLAPAMIHCAGVPSVVIRNCQLMAQTTLLRLQPDSRNELSGANIVVSNSVMQAASGFTLELGQDVNVEMERCLVRSERNLFTLHRKRQARQNGKCTLQLTSNSIIAKGPIIGFGDADIVDATEAILATNAWSDRSFWTAGIFPGRRANSDVDGTKMITRNYQAFLDLLGAKESDPVIIKNNQFNQFNQLTKDNLRSVARKFPAKRRPDVRILGPGSGFDAFRDSALYQRIGR